MHDTFSIIIPVYNVAPYLRECLDSVLAQTFTDWEAICVDDGSTDESGEILDEYSRRDARIRVVHKRNEGVSVARNRALEIASGEWLMFMDADDMYCKDALQRIKRIIDDNDFDAYFIDEILDFEHGTHPDLMSTGSGRITRAITRPQIGKDLLFDKEKLWGFPVIRVLRRSVFGDVLFPPGVPMMEDLISLVSLLAKQARWAKVDICVYLRRLHSGGAHVYINSTRAFILFDAFYSLCRDAVEKLGCSPCEMRFFVRRNIGSLQKFTLWTIVHEAPHKVRAIARRYFAFKKDFGGKCFSLFNDIRCRVALVCGRPIMFRLISEIEKVSYVLRRLYRRGAK